MSEDGCRMGKLTKLGQYVRDNADKLRSAARLHGKATLMELLALSVPTGTHALERRRELRDQTRKVRQQARHPRGLQRRNL